MGGIQERDPRKSSHGSVEEGAANAYHRFEEFNMLLFKRKRSRIHKIPVIDLGDCIQCESCIEVCPTVFRKNSETGILEVIDLSEYPEEDVHQAISVCPTDCITWEDA